MCFNLELHRVGAYRATSKTQNIPLKIKNERGVLSDYQLATVLLFACGYFHTQLEAAPPGFFYEFPQVFILGECGITGKV